MEQARYNSHSSLPQTLTFRRPVVLDWHRVELFRCDVTEVLSGKRSDDEAPASESLRRPRSSPRFKAAQQALKELYGDAIPNQVALPNKLLITAVIAKLKEQNLSEVSDDTILRAAGRRK